MILTPRVNVYPILRRSSGRLFLYFVRMRFFLVILLCALTGCLSGPSEEQVLPAPPAMPKQGAWRLTFDLGGAELPVNVTVRMEKTLVMDFHNASEVLTAHELDFNEEGLIVRMPYFDSEFHGQVSEDGKRYTGVWRNFSKGRDYAIPFTATYGEDYRFCPPEMGNVSSKVSGKYEVHFSPQDTAGTYAAIGVFEGSHKDNSVTGTFLTETGDYRFLQGNICGKKLNLSCFDGSHAFLFTADWDGKEISNGEFRSGKHWSEPWSADRNEEFELHDPDKLTMVVDSSLIWKTKIYDEKGSRFELGQLRLENKVVIIQTMGSWCPNCMDESKVYAEFFDRYNDKGLEIISVAFENTKDPLEARYITSELRSDLGLPYPIYFGGDRSKKTASEVFPALNHVMSYPTSIIIGRDGEVRKVHTGFYGPGTGQYYDNWKHDMELLLEQLLAEN